jgi:crossover junction endodeoxyribonuclease RuvC
MRVLGVDPGTAVTGYGVVDGGAGRFRHVASGTVRPAASERGPGRLKTIHDGLLSVIDAYAPEVMSLERSFVAVNVQSAFRLGEARAAAMLAAAERGLGFFEYPPNEVKLAVAAFGHADKAQVKFMIRRALGLDDALALADDAADALALAICHLSRSRIQRLGDAARSERRRMPARRNRQ